MKRHAATLIAILALAILSTPQTVVAQKADSEEVVSLVLEHVVQHIRSTEALRDGPVRVDDRVAEARSALAFTEEVRGERAHDAISAKILARPGRFEELRRCPGATPRECILLDTSIALAASAPLIRASEARIVVHAMYMTKEARQPVHQGSWEYMLERVEGEWMVVSFRALGAT